MVERSLQTEIPHGLKVTSLRLADSSDFYDVHFQSGPRGPVYDFHERTENGVHAEQQSANLRGAKFHELAQETKEHLMRGVIWMDSA